MSIGRTVRCPGISIYLNITPVDLWGHFQKRLAYELVDWAKQLLSKMWVGITLFCWGLEYNKKTEESWICSLPDCWAGTSIFTCPWHSWFSGLQTRAGIYTIDSSVLRPSNYTTDFPGSPACRWQIGLLRFHNHVSQFLTMNLIIYREIYYIQCIL